MKILLLYLCSALLFIVQFGQVKCCRTTTATFNNSRWDAASASRATTVQSTFGPTANQSVTPAMPSSVGSSCGHSMYYKPGIAAGVIGGVTAQIGQYPWLVRLSITTSAGSALCGGTIIGDRWILTAAHCCEPAISANGITAYVADWNKTASNPNRYTTTMSSIIKHPKYDSVSLDYDFCLLQTEITFDFTANWYTQKICLPSSSSDCCTAGSAAYIAGWGLTDNFGSRPEVMQSAYVPILNQETCQKNLSGIATITDSMLCAGFSGGGADTCAGDSGGPLMSVASGFYKLCGVTSFGSSSGCGIAGSPGVYSKVCSAIDWINSFVSSSTTPTNPPNQNSTAPPPPPVISTCGHSSFYNSADIPGSGLVSGINATMGRYPWIVRLNIFGKNETVQCGGSIVNERWIITTAYCCKVATSPSSIRVYVADLNTDLSNPYRYTATVVKVLAHPSYDSKTHDYDFCLLQTATLFNFTKNWYTQKICLPTSKTDCCTAGSTAYIAGWGVTSNSQQASISSMLQTAYVKIATQATCQSEYSGIAAITDRMICAGWPSGGANTCSGDSGGPLMSMESGYFKLCGVASFGIQYGCGVAGFETVYARVCSVIDWVNPVIASSG